MYIFRFCSEGRDKILLNFATLLFVGRKYAEASSLLSCETSLAAIVNLYLALLAQSEVLGLREASVVCGNDIKRATIVRHGQVILICLDERVLPAPLKIIEDALGGV